MHPVTAASSELERLLAGLLEAAPASAGDDPGRVCTLEVLRRLATRWPDPPAPGDRNALEILCRKIGVAGRVWEAYDRDWKRRASSSPLTGPGYSLLAGVLLGYASALGQLEDTEGPGPALKCLNAAFGALDLAGGCGDAVALAELEEAADRVVERLLPAP